MSRRFRTTPSWTLDRLLGRKAARRQLAAAAPAADVLEPRTMLSGATAYEGPDLGIVGGTTATTTEYPFIVSMQREGIFQASNHYCGGTLIRADAVLTATHCGAVVGDTIVAGASDLRSSAGVQTRTVVQVIDNPNFIATADTLENDITVLILDSPFEMTDTVQTVDFATPADAEFFEPGDVATAIGYGARFNGGSVSNRLQEVDIPIQSVATANAVDSYNGVITDNMLPAGSPFGNRDTSQGDSGGPLLVRDAEGEFIVAGITSFGFSSGRADFPGIYTRVENYVDFIREALDSTSGNGSISGTVFEDANANGIQDNGESGLPGVEVFIDENGDGRRGVVKSETETFVSDDPVLDPLNNSEAITVAGLDEFQPAGTELYQEFGFFGGSFGGPLTTDFFYTPAASAFVEVDSPGQIADLVVDVGFASGSAEAFQFFLTSPNGTTIRLFNALGIEAGDGPIVFSPNIQGPLEGLVTLDDEADVSVLQGLDDTFGGFFIDADGNVVFLPFGVDGTYRPDQMLSLFDGEDAAGTWRLDAAVRAEARGFFVDDDDNRIPIPPGDEPFVIEDFSLTVSTLLDGSEPFTRTDAEGNYAFEGLNPGSFDVTITDFGGLSAGRPPGVDQVIPLAPGENATADFALVREARPQSVVGFSPRGAALLAESDGSTFQNRGFGRVAAFGAVTDTFLGDFTGDGLDDLLTREVPADDLGGVLSPRFRLRAATAGGFADPVDFGSADDLADYRTGDFNGDGRLDVLGRRTATGNHVVFLNRDSGFERVVYGALPTGNDAEFTLVGDLDADGDSDIVVRDDDGTLYAGIATNGRFVTRRMTRWNPATEFVDVTLADINGNGRADIVARIERNGQFYVGITKNGLFDMRVLRDGLDRDVDYNFGGVGDFDGNGKADLIYTRADTGDVFEFTPRGTRGLTERVGKVPAPSIDPVILDLDGDSIDDFAVRDRRTGVWKALIGLDEGFARTRNWGRWDPTVDWQAVQAADISPAVLVDPADRGDDDDPLGLDSLMASTAVDAMLSEL